MKQERNLWAEADFPAESIILVQPFLGNDGCQALLLASVANVWGRSASVTRKTCKVNHI